ncbi:phosphoglycolate phosphatase [Caulobacter sp. KR2-114]|uniref:phosphoglycolate phosphatase n=1 Tax=Caulobacter sp. KR2-114 TaxID=3400912 RepID=UPI003C07DE86
MTQSAPADLAALSGATIVFDLDGTLVDSAPDLVGTLNFLLQEEGVAPLPMSQARDMIGRGARALLVQGFLAAGAPVSDGRLDQLFDRFIAHYEGRIADESTIFPGVLPALDTLRSAGARLAVCTNKRTGLSVQLLQALGFADRFDAIIGADSAPAPKPDPRHLTAAIAAAGGDPARAVMVGDSISDAGAARAAQAALVLVSFGYTETSAAELGADILIDHYDQLVDACSSLLASCPPSIKAL